MASPKIPEGAQVKELPGVASTPKYNKPHPTQLIANPHTGTVMILMSNGDMYERELDNTAYSGIPQKRYKWSKVKGPFDE